VGRGGFQQRLSWEEGRVQSQARPGKDGKTEMHTGSSVWSNKALARLGLPPAEGNAESRWGFAPFGIGYNLPRAENIFTFNELMERAGRKAA